MLEFVDSGLYFVQDEKKIINPLLQGGSGSGSWSLISTAVFFSQTHQIDNSDH